MDINLAAALKWLSAAVSESSGHTLREPEILILKGTWRGLTYEQMSEESEYSTNYLMRDVAPKLWKQLSSVFGRPVSKTNFRVALEARARADQTTFREKLSGDIAAIDILSEEASDEVFPPKLSTALSTLQNTFTLTHADTLKAADVSAALPLYGYDAETTKIKHWVRESLNYGASGTAWKLSPPTNGKGCLIGIWGLAGVGKSYLCEAVAAQLEPMFDFVLWRSLTRKPSIDDFCNGVLARLGLASAPPEQSTERLLAALTQHSVLLIVENVEAILQPGTFAGDYQLECRAYSDFFQSISSSRSCLMLTGTESPTDCLNQSGHSKNQHSLYLTGLSEDAAMALLANESLSYSDHWPELIARYQGHPLALQSAARVIRDMFNGRVDTFLQQTSALFTDLLRLLAPSFERLSEIELGILYWFASQKQSLSLSELQQSLPTPMNSTELISALDSLKQRSYLAIQTTSEPPKFQLPPLIKTYAVQQLMAQFKKGSAQHHPTGQLLATPHSAPAHEDVITLSAPVHQPVHLSQWFYGSVGADWQPLDQILETTMPAAMRLCNAYHLRDETFIKRCKSVYLQAMYHSEKSQAGQSQAGQSQVGQSQVGQSQVGQSKLNHEIAASAILLVAVRQEANGLYKICIQAQPAKDAYALPENLEIRLLDTQQNLLATVEAVQDDTFIQLPYFQGQLTESFRIELAINDLCYAETFLI